MQNIKYAFFLIIAIIGNPLYQILSFLGCSELELTSYISTNVSQVNLFAFLGILGLIFLVRLGIYTLIFKPKKYPFSTKGSDSFLYIFSERHLYQVIGLFTFFLWVSPLEGNIVGFIVFPITILLGLVLSIVTFVRILKIKKILMEKGEGH